MSDLPSPGTDSEDDLALLLERELDQEEPEGPDAVIPVFFAGSAAQAVGPTEGLCKAPEDSGRAAKRLKTSKDMGEGICPPHPGFMHGMCIRCGQVQADAKIEGEHLKLRYIHAGLQVSGSEAERLRTESLARSRMARKLLLILDLDHTLLNSSRFDEVGPADEARLADLVLAEAELTPESRSVYQLTQMRMWTKLRPFARGFLAAAHELAEMHIYTHGDAEYAALMAGLLDPDRCYFADRIISQGDSTRQHIKNLDVVLGAESLAVIVDDTEGVWPSHLDNLIQVERYIFFPACAQRFGQEEQGSLLQQQQDEDPDVGQLSVVLGVLRSLHTSVFPDDGSEAGEQDVRRHLAQLQGTILSGANVVFSHVIPLGFPDPEQHPVWRLATKLGATCSLTVGPQATHLIAGAPNTDKVRWARLHKVPALAPSWLYACKFLWRRLDEEGFRIGEVEEQHVLPTLDSELDLAIAIASAGGGRGDVDVE